MTIKINNCVYPLYWRSRASGLLGHFCIIRLLGGTFSNKIAFVRHIGRQGGLQTLLEKYVTSIEIEWADLNRLYTPII